MLCFVGQVKLSECTDHHEHCSYWAYTGHCRKNPQYMLVSCKYSCNMCDTGRCDTFQCGLLRSTITRTHTIRVVSNQARGFYDVPRESIVMPCAFRVWRHFVVAGTLGLDLTRQASTLCSRHESILDEKTPIERFYLIFDYY